MTLVQYSSVLNNGMLLTGDTIWLTTHDYKNVIYLGWTDADRSAIYDGFLRFWSFIIVLQVRVYDRFL